MQRLFLACVLIAISAGAAHAQAPLDLIPQEAAVALAIRNLDELAGKGDRLLKESELKIPFRPSQVFEIANGFLGVNKGLNKKGAAAILLLRPTKGKFSDNTQTERWDELIVPVVPFTDADAMAGNFLIPKGGLRANAKPIATKSNGPNTTKFATRTNSHLLLSQSAATLARIQKSKSISEVFTPAQRKQLNDSDILLHFGPQVWEQEGANFSRLIGDRIRPGNDPREAEFTERFLSALQQIQHGVFAARVEDGLGLQFVANVPGDSDASKLFQSLRGVRPASTLSGLPEGNVLLAQAFASDEKQHSLIAKGFFKFLLQDLLTQAKIVAPVDQINYLEILHEVWRKLDGNRLALYQNADERRLGLFSVIAILDTRDGPEFVREMKSLMKLADAGSLDFTRKEVREAIGVDKLVSDLSSNVYAVRLSASTKLALIGEPALPYLKTVLEPGKLGLEGRRRVQDIHARITAVAAERRRAILGAKDATLFVRPMLTFVPAVEKRANLNIDAVHIKLMGMGQAANQPYIQLLGPDWDKMRFAVVGKQVIVLLGSDVNLFEAAIKNVQSESPGLAESKRLAAFQKGPAKDRIFEFHVSTEGMLRVLNGNAGKEAALTSIGFSLDARSLQFDAWLPMSEVRAIARKTQEELR